MADFNEAEQLVKMQVVPDQVEGDGAKLTQRYAEQHGMAQSLVRDTSDLNLDPENVAELLDRRSELMKRGRVKRVFYKVTDEIQSHDMRREFDDLEELEDQ